MLTDMKVFFYREVSFRGMKYNNTGCHARYDFFLPDFNTCIEYDGEDWHSDKKAIQRDKLKTNFCVINKIKLVRFNITNYRLGLESEVKKLMDNSYYVKYPFRQIDPIAQKRSTYSLQKKKEAYKKRVDKAHLPASKGGSSRPSKSTERFMRGKSKNNAVGCIYPQGMSKEQYELKKVERALKIEQYKRGILPE